MDNIHTFSQEPGRYARHRPVYPRELFELLNTLAQGHAAVWDCATGSGQAALACADFFERVEATDLSLEQLRHAAPHPRVRYQVCRAEQAPFANESFDLLSVALALHWFDLKQFYAEARRVLKPGGLLAAWGYGFFSIQPEIDSLISRDLFEPLDPFWAQGNRLLMAGYRDLPLPFDEITGLPEFVIRLDWNLEQLLAYLRTWSAVKRYVAEVGSDPVSRLENSLKALWESPAEVKLVQMPLFLKVGRRPA